MMKLAVAPVVLLLFLAYNDWCLAKPKRCFLPLAGTCKPHKRRYYYNSQSGKCEEFLFTGFRGNWNRFVFKKICELVCKKVRPRRRCSLPRDPGSCKQRYYYNSQSGQCEEFKYTGFVRNGFVFKKICENICKPRAYSKGSCRLNVRAGDPTKMFDKQTASAYCSDTGTTCNIPGTSNHTIIRPDNACNEDTVRIKYSYNGDSSCLFYETIGDGDNDCAIRGDDQGVKLTCSNGVLYGRFGIKGASGSITVNNINEIMCDTVPAGNVGPPCNT